MEFADYLNVVRRSAGLLIGIVIVATGLTATLVARQPTRYEGAVSATVYQVVPVQTQANTPYQFDSFYTLQGASLFAEQLKAKFSDPAFVAEIFTQAQLGAPARRLVDVGRAFTTKRYDPATVQIQFDHLSRETVTAALTAAGKQLQAATATLQANGTASAVRLDVGQPYVLSYQSSVGLTSAIAFVASLFVGLSLIFLVEFARPRSK